MLKIVKKIFIISITLFSLVTCDNYEFPKSPYPRIETLPVVNISETGVTFQANITQLGANEIINHGFVWGLDEEIFINDEDKIELGAISAMGSFEADVKSGLIEGETYFVKAFVATADYFIYGKTLSFISKGSTPPLINVLSSNDGTAADTIEIRGKYFSALAGNNKVKFGQETSIVLASTDSTIQCIVPNLTANQDYSISVDVAGNLTTSEIRFHVLQPKIESMTPMAGIFGDIITLSGENFPIKKSYINLTLDGIVCEVLDVSRSAIRFVVPNNLNRSRNQVIAKISSVNVSAGELTVFPPAIDNITNSVLSMYTNPALVITGSNFSPLTTKNEVRIGGYSCPILSSSLNQLTIQAPREIIPDIDLSVQDTFDIIVKVLDQFAVIENKIEVTYLSRWTRMKDFPGNSRIFGASFTINESAYVGLGSGEEFDNWYKDFWEYDPLNDSWTKLPDFPGVARSKFVTLVINSKAYIITGTIGNQYTATNNLNEVWEFDPSTKSWTQKSNFPGGARYGAFGFVINEYGYVGAGVYGNYTPKYDFWKYDAENDNWIQLNNLSNSLWYEDIFALSNNIDGYILTNSCGSPCGKRYFWKYDKVNDAWLDVVDMPGSYDETTGFSLNGNFYVGTGIFSSWPGTSEFFEFNVSSNTWSRKEFKGEARRRASSFAIGNYGYLLLGKGECHCANLYDVWRFDPSKP